MLPMQMLLVSFTGLLWPPIGLDAMPPPDPSAAKAAVVVRLAEEDPAPPGQQIRIQALQPDNATDQRITLRQQNRGGSADLAADGPWLGIQYGPVPKPLAAHLKLAANEGQMVLNVVQGSPADEAGLTKYDVIMSLNGTAVQADARAFLEQVAALKPGTTTTLEIIQAGVRRDVKLTVGERPTADRATRYKYEPEPEELLQGRIFRRGGLMEQDDQGNWVLRDLNLPDLPDMFEWWPDDEDLLFNFKLPDAAVPGRTETLIFKSQKSGSVRIERSSDGQIKVTRVETDPDGDTRSSTTTYADEDALQKADPEAYELLKKSGVGSDDRKPRRHRLPDPAGILRQFEEANRHWSKARERAAGEQSRAEMDDGNFAAPPRIRFELLPDGGIRVTQRQGDAERVQTFADVAAMKAQRPDLHEQYEKLQSATRGAKQ